jgi:hypothetical protein
MYYGTCRSSLAGTAAFLLLVSSSHALILDDFTAGAASSPEELNQPGFLSIEADLNSRSESVTQSGLDPASVVGGSRNTTVFVSHFSGDAPTEVTAAAGLVAYSAAPGLGVSMYSSPGEWGHGGGMALTYGGNTSNIAVSDMDIDILGTLGVSSSEKIEFSVSLSDVFVTGEPGSSYYVSLELRSGNETLYDLQQLYMEKFISDPNQSRLAWSFLDFEAANPMFDFSDVDGIQLTFAQAIDGVPAQIPFSQIDLTLTDFSVSAVPEPSTYTLMLGVLGLGFVVARSRRKGGSHHE